MAKINENVGIQFLKGENEKEHPEIRLFRSKDGKKGHVLYKFDKPKTITIQNFKSIQKMYLIDEEGELSTRKIDLSISEGHIIEVKSTYSWVSEKEFERFMRFASRYANSIASN
tara:strand:- start:1343 stop:1684 length:342 start_codon:yes stop_codon:yes gene_type:complete